MLAACHILQRQQNGWVIRNARNLFVSDEVSG
jgi:hypothetical protein